MASCWRASRALPPCCEGTSRVAIRPAIPADLKAVLAIAGECFTGGDAVEVEWLIDLLAQPGTAMLVDAATFAIVRGFLITESYQLGTEVRLIATAKEHRRSGVGKRLLASVRGPATTWIRTRNTASRRLFESLGWKKTEPPKRREEWVYYQLPKA